MTHEEALKRAVLWIDALVGVADIEPEECDITLTFGGRDAAGAPVEVKVEANLAEDLAAFRALGAAGMPELHAYDEVTTED